MFSQKDQIKHDNCVLIPWLTLNSTFTIAILTGALKLTNGFAYFCETFNTNFLLDSKHYSSITCRNLQFIPLETLSNQYLFDYLIISIGSAWLLFILSNLINATIILRVVYVFQTIEYKEYNQELLMIKYARITKRNRMNKSYDIQLPL